MMINTFLENLIVLIFFLLWLLMKFKTLNIQENKILGASACSLWKIFLIFFTCKCICTSIFILYTKLCPLKMEIRHSSQILKVVKNFDRTGNTFLVIWTVLLHTVLFFPWKLSEIKNIAIISIVGYHLTKNVWRSTSLALITLVLKLSHK